MDTLYADQVQFGQKGSLHGSIDETQGALELLENVRASLVADASTPAATFARLQSPLKKSLESINGKLKDVHKASTAYSKALDKRLKSKPAHGADDRELASDIHLDRAIGMHLLRGGQFGVATAFLDEIPQSTGGDGEAQRLRENPTALRASFEEMYYILQEMRTSRNLAPAMDWAQARTKVLQERGSDLEFELTKLQFIWLFAGPTESSRNGSQRLVNSMMYARESLSRFEGRYLREIQQLLGAMAYSPNLGDSPYRHIFESAEIWEDAALSFTREYCSILGLSADSPLFIATTAGAMALPRLDKLHTIMKEKRTEWTTAHELPVEIPLPPSYRFHSIFVCPVSKEQTTETNPPMLLPCCHVIAQESLGRISKMGKYKCPYCPTESHYNHAKRVFL